MGIIVWIVQILLALAFLIHGRMMLVPPSSQPTSQPQAQRGGMEYILAIQPVLRRFIGVAEIAAAIGLILPQLTGVLPWVTPLAATGLVIIMVAAIIFHIPRQEYQNIVLNVILLVLSAFVAYMRWFVLPN